MDVLRIAAIGAMGEGAASRQLDIQEPDPTVYPWTLTEALRGMSKLYRDVQVVPNANLMDVFKEVCIILGNTDRQLQICKAYVF